MRIAIEARRIFQDKKHGMDFVALEMIRELQKIDDTNQYRIFVSPGPDVCLYPTHNFAIETLPAHNHLHFEQVKLPRAVKEWQADVLHCTSNTAPTRSVKAKLVITLHDVIFLERGTLKGVKSNKLSQKIERLYHRFVVPRVADKATKIITVSAYERDIICHKLKICPSIVEVIYNGFGAHFMPEKLDNDTIEKYGLPGQKQYIFFIGNSDPKKNAKGVFEAYSLYLNMANEPLKLVVADLSTPEMRRIAGKKNWAKIKDYIVEVGYIKNSILPQFYSGAILFLYPSLRESFGIPPLEAMACGTPVLSSTLSAIPEILDKSAMLINPTDPKILSKSIIELSEDKSLIFKYSMLGNEHCRQYSWRTNAESLLKLYNSL